jgi:hypothetical protein
VQARPNSGVEYLIEHDVQVVVCPLSLH